MSKKFVVDKTLKNWDNHFVSCPFNKQHQVLASRLQYHIVRCMKNYPDYETCPYNACHRMKPEEYKQHVDACPQRNLLANCDDLSVSRAAVCHLPPNDEFHFQYEDWTKDAYQDPKK